MFTLKIKTDNAAFDDGNLEAEIARILREVADAVDGRSTEGKVRDINGNTVGEFKLESIKEA